MFSLSVRYRVLTNAQRLNSRRPLGLTYVLVVCRGSTKIRDEGMPGYSLPVACGRPSRRRPPPLPRRRPGGLSHRSSMLSSRRKETLRPDPEFPRGASPLRALKVILALKRVQSDPR
eukprot:357013-Rhodomonas_salina.1